MIYKQGQLLICNKGNYIMSNKFAIVCVKTNFGELLLYSPNKKEGLYYRASSRVYERYKKVKL